MTTRTYVLDTSVLLSDPWAVMRFAEHHVVLPLVVISELEGKRHHHELGWFAREALRMLDDMRLEHGRLDLPLEIGDEGGTLQVELNHTDPAVLPAGFRTDSNDSRILACALNLRAEGKDVTLVSKDTPLRVKAGAVGLAADEYHAQDVVVSGWSGMTELDVATATVDTLFAEGVVDLDEARELPCHTGVRLLSATSSALGRVNADKRVQLVRGDREAFGLHGRSAEQRVALDLHDAGWQICHVPDLVAHHHPSPVRDAPGIRRAGLTRSRLLTAVLRLPAGAVAVICVALLTVKLAAGLPPKLTAVAPVKPARKTRRWTP